MDTSGTGHDRCPSEVPDPLKASSTPPRGGIGKIKKSVFGFKRAAEIFVAGFRFGLNERLSGNGRLSPWSALVRRRALMALVGHGRFSPRAVSLRLLMAENTARFAEHWAAFRSHDNL